jgi:hypothetical protein
MQWFDEGCSKLLDQRNQAKLQSLHDPSEINGDNMSNVRCEATSHFWNIEGEYLKDKIHELAINSKNRDLYTGIMNLRGLPATNNLVKDENHDLLADSHNILNRWKKLFSQLLNVNDVSDVMQIEVHSAEPLVPGPSHLEVQIAIAKLKKYKLPSSD